MSKTDSFKLLHVEDSETDAFLISRHLQNNNFDIKLAKCRSEFECLVATNQFDLILCDHYLPDLNSEDALNIVRKKDPYIPFIILSGALPPGVAVKLMDNGANDFLYKDRPERLGPAILNALSKRKLEKERLQLQKQILYSENRFRKLVESAQDIICILNREYRITYHSPSIEKLVNVDGEIFGENILDIINFENPQRFSELLRECKNSADRLEEILDFRRSDSHSIYKIILKNHLDDEGIDGIIVKFRDITNDRLKDKSLQEKDEKLRAFYENSIDGIILAKTNGIITSANPAMCVMFGMQESELTGLHRSAIVHTDENRVAELLEERRISGKAKSELELIKKDGTVFPAEVSSSIIPFNRNGRRLKKTATIIRDITEHKEHVRQINDTAQKLQYAEKIARIGYLELNLKENTVYCSGEVSNILDIENCNELKVEEFRSLVLEEDLYIFEDIKSSVLNRGDTKNIELRIHVCKSEIRWLNVIVSPLMDGDEIVGGKGTLQDITEKKLNFEKLAISENRYKSLIQSQTNYFVRLDTKGNFTYCNQRYIDDFGWLYPGNNPIGENSLIDSLPSQYEKIQETNAKCLKNPFRNYQIDITKLGKNEHNKATIWDIVFLKSDNGESELQCVGIDISDRVKAEDENKFQANILSKIGQGVVATDAVGNIKYFNAAAEKIYGWKYEEVKDENLVELMFPDLYESDLLKEILEKLSYDHTFSSQYNGRKSDGTVFPVQITMSGILDQEGSLSGVICIFSDISRLKKSENKLRELNENLTSYTNELVSANKGLEQFSYIVSHNLRAPVANIIGISEIIADEDIDSDMRDKLQCDMLNNVKRLDTVVRDLNNILKVKADYNNSRELVDFQCLTDNVIHMTGALISEDQVTIKTNFSDFKSMLTSRSYLHSVFYNIILNSIKYKHPERELILQISSRSGKEFNTLTFLDNGLGIELGKNREELFELYKRHHHHIEGKGMGLFMVKTQLDLIGGKISLESEPNEWTKITIQFPNKVVNSKSENP
ncbi:PAS domain S-box-containing protein [Gramella sp. Hel_I_59]|uniref:PAS domain S-box protein n=1 Tax=Gramella sp. Hel_I_59 TaxID=1249978 RepID=UPI0011511E94|nr:PAS domain S-box protein [Gramella sp. Hel_I_59]TQI70807.1 PAS domain S-box-containing protein [Gramella sp. Hel_I_59]